MSVLNLYSRELLAADFTGRQMSFIRMDPQPLVSWEVFIAYLARIASLFMKVSLVRVQIAKFVEHLTAMLARVAIMRVTVIHVCH